MLRTLLPVALAALASAAAAPAAPSGRGAGLLQGGAGARAADTPITRVVGLLKDMSKTLQSDMDKDEALYKELSCWCNNGDYEKTEAIKASTAKIEELEATIGSLTARSSQLSTTIK